MIWNWRSTGQVATLDRRVQGLVEGARDAGVVADPADPADPALAHWAFWSEDGLLVVRADGAQACRRLAGHTALVEGGMWLPGARLLSWRSTVR